MEIKDDLSELETKTTKSTRKTWMTLLAIILVLAATGAALYQVPTIHNRTNYYVARVRAKIYYFLKPPAEGVFDPSHGATISADVAGTLTAMAPTPTSTSTVTPGTAASIESSPTLTPIATATLIPQSVVLEGIVQEYQRENSCGPATLSLALRYWGWEGDQIAIEQVIKPNIKDRNVTPQEMLYFIENHTSLNAVLRYGGNLELLKQFIAAGYPVLIERGYVNKDDGWMGHYGVLDAYDDAQQAFHIPDTFNGNIWIDYKQLQDYWNEFANTYLVIYPDGKDEEIYTILGKQADPAVNLDYAIDLYTRRVDEFDQSQQYFAYHSLGELLVLKKDYVKAAEAFDDAFAVYGWLSIYDRPWRMLWYQTGSYEAYYYTGRHNDVIRLAFKTITDASEPALPETFLWSGRANVALGNIETAIFEFKRALQWHPGWQPAVDELKALGIDI